jgi:hypothetical protein
MVMCHPTHYPHQYQQEGLVQVLLKLEKAKPETTMIEL